MRRWISFVIVLIIVAIGIRQYMSLGREGYGPCRGCNGYTMPSTSVVSNPFIWPRSGHANVNDVYILAKDTDIDLNIDSGPLTSLNEPDHVIKTS